MILICKHFLFILLRVHFEPFILFFCTFIFIYRSICVCCPDQVPKIITFLNPLLNSSVDVQRIISVSLFVEFLSQTYRGKQSLTEPLINNLLGRLVDNSPVVRGLCISGLGSIAMLDKDQVICICTNLKSSKM